MKKPSTPRRLHSYFFILHSKFFILRFDPTRPHENRRAARSKSEVVVQRNTREPVTRSRAVQTLRNDHSPVATPVPDPPPIGRFSAVFWSHCGQRSSSCALR